MPWSQKEETNDLPSTSTQRETNGETSPTTEMPCSKGFCPGAKTKAFVGDCPSSSLRCGLGFCTFDWLQKLHTAKWLLAILCICAFNQSFVINAIFPVGLSTLEKRFQMSSTRTGIISSWYDFAVLIAVFPVCYYGNYGHKGRWISVGSLIMALGSAVCVLPHFSSAPWHMDQSQMDSNNDFGQCALRNTSRPDCVPSADVWGASDAYFVMFLLGQTLHGFGATPLFSLGTAYLDENVSENSSPVFLAIHSFLTSVGPIVGLFVGGKLLTFYDDFDSVSGGERLAIKDSADPRWVGAWWVGFAACSVVSLIISFPIMAKKRRENEMHTVTKMDTNDDILCKKSFRLLSKDILILLSSPTFVAIIFVGIFESIVLNGFSSFMPKILEIILNTSPTVGSYLSSVVIFGAAGGVMVGGILVRQLQLQCPSRELVGLTVAYDHNSSSSVTLLENPCNSECHCDANFRPVCDRSSGRTYYSACYAGCSLRQEEIDGIGTLWGDCRCVRNVSLPTNANFSPARHLANGFCPVDCGWTLWLFLFLLFLSVVASFAAGIPTQQIMLRVIPLQQRTLGIAVNWTFLRLLGFIPGGVLFGYMIDTACLKWQESPCGKKLSCQVYDTSRLSWTIMALAVASKLVAILATTVGYVTYSPSDLDSYHDALKNVLKLRHAGDIGDTDSADLDGIGMSRPEQRRLMREYAKHYALEQRQQNGVVWKKFRLKVFGEAKQCKQRKVTGETDHWQGPGGEAETAQQPQHHIIPPERVTLCKKIGTGEFGHVFQAAWRDATGDGKKAIQVAVKRILPEKLISQHASFLQEAAIMTRMHHPNVIRLFGVVLETKAVMLVSELAPCGSLLECLQCPSWREPFSVAVLSDFALQIAQGMRYLSSHRLIHRDLAARNVLVCTPSKVKISDFGLSRCLGHGEDYYRSEFTPSMKLPIAWCAPECINFLRFTSASDVWAYGICLWEMFSYGKTPWEGMSGSQILHSIDTQRKKLHCPEACPREAYLLMLNCWEWEAHLRPTFEQICDRLPSMVPPLLVTICESGTTKSGHLNYGRDETIALLDKNPCAKEGLWRGISKAGKVGLFRPEDTIAFLGAENPSAKGDALSEQLRTEKGKMKKQLDKEKKRKKAVEISEPKGDLRHTCHVGADGRSFGLLNVNKSDLARALPPKVDPPLSNDGQMRNTFPPADGVMILPPLMTTSMVSLPPPRPPKNGTKQRKKTEEENGDEMTRRNDQLLLISAAGHCSVAEYLNASSAAASLSPPALPPKPPRFRSFANFSDWPFPSAPSASPMDTLNQPKFGQQIQSPINLPDQTHPPEPIHHNSEPTEDERKRKRSKETEEDRGRKSDEEAEKRGKSKEKREGKDGGRDREGKEEEEEEEKREREGKKEEEREEERENEGDESLIIRPSSVCCEFSSKGEDGEEEKRILQVLTDLQRDLTNFSLCSLDDCSEGRPLLDGEQRREKKLTEEEERKRHLRELSLERHGIVTGHSAEIVGMDRAELERRTNEERRRVLKKLVRDGGEESADEKRASVVGSFISSASKMLVGGTNHSTNGGPPMMAFPPSSKEPLANWPPEAQEAYKLLVQCGHNLKGTSINEGHSEVRKASPKSDDGTLGQTAEMIELPKKIEYINSMLVGWEGEKGGKRSDRKDTLERRSDRRKDELYLAEASLQNESQSPLPVPPKPMARARVEQQ
ncbi:hypothetical protein niasHS_014806 [Heterodera schachtii]|uniref:non-specific protein-tyrosine kinase n=1 Tax=Heterodera schachtii TaxID=97005 RepID=A0ABD2IFP6_HETSC